MKKIFKYFSFVVGLLLFSGCNMLSNTPTKRVEEFLDSYIHNNSSVLTQLSDMVNTDSLMDDMQRSTYTDIMKKQYKDMTYEILDEKIDGDTATVTAEIEVYDFYKINTQSEEYYNNNPSEFTDDKNSDDQTVIKSKEQKYVEYRLNRLKDATDRIKYQIDFTLTKDKNNWKLSEIDDPTRQKIHGLYPY